MFRIADQIIGKGYKPFIIAEISANHGGNIERAKSTISAAKAAGADAVKIQSYTPETMTLDSNKDDFVINDGIWQGYNLYQLYQQASLPFEWHKYLLEYARQHDIILFSTPFDETAVDLLENLNVPAYKIASFELTDLPLIEYVAAKGKPLLMSTGLADLDEIGEALECSYKAGNTEVLLFHCISSYPAELRSSHLSDIAYLSQHFNVEVGLSDHTTSNLASTLAVSHGASAIEKHFKLDDTDCGPDASFSILPAELKSLCEDCRHTFEAFKFNGFKRTESELANKKFRRSIYFVRSLSKGDVITSDDIKRVRPGYGLSPKYVDFVIGKKVSVDVSFGDAVTLNRNQEDTI